MSLQLAAWTKDEIDAICRKPYGVYERELGEHYRQYFAYFHHVKSWAGWPDLLSTTLKAAERLERLGFRAVSWQELIPQLPLEESVLVWAREKHALL